MLPILLAVSSTMSEINPSDVEFPVKESTSHIEITDTPVNMEVFVLQPVLLTTFATKDQV